MKRHKWIKASGIAALLLSAAGMAVAQSGGPYTITQSVIAGGGGRSAGGTYTLDGTAGQALAGTTSAGGSYSLTGGFWGAGAAAPPAEQFVTVSGEVRSPAQLQLRNVLIELVAPGNVVTPFITNNFGEYSFTNVRAGLVYTIRVKSKRYTFNSFTGVISTNLTNFNFIGDQ